MHFQSSQPVADGLLARHSISGAAAVHQNVFCTSAVFCEIRRPIRPVFQLWRMDIRRGVKIEHCSMGCERFTSD